MTAPFGGRGWLAAGLLGLVAAAAPPATAHWVSPEEIVGRFNGEQARKTAGVERAERDSRNARVLLVYVGERWYALPASARRALAGSWLDLWKHNVPQGIVAVLDARTDTPVVRFAGGRQVADVVDGPPGPGSDQGGGRKPPASR
jgi:hypothetical protein